MNINLDTVKQAVKAAVEPLRARARGMVRRAVLRALDNAGGLARVQVELTRDELADGVELLSWPGISIRPEGCEAIVFAVGGNPSNLIALPSQRGKRLTGDGLAAGEVALHIGNKDQLVRLKNDGTVVLQSGTDGATVTLKPTGDIVLDVPTGRKIFAGADGALHPLALGDEVDAMLAHIRTEFNAHKHFSTGLIATTTEPIPGTFATVMSGITGAPNAPLTGITSVESDTIFGVS